jgi:predicted dehydrogenase
VIASPTSNHFENLSELAGTNFRGTCIVEKPLFDALKDLSKTIQFVVGVGYNLRFLPTIQRLRMLLQNEEVLTASFYNGEFLPDWRPGRDYRTTSSASQTMGGGVLRDLSHEVDFVHYLLGAPSSAMADVSNSGTLEIETDDIVRAVLKHANGCTSTLALSYLDKTRRREIIFATKKFSIHCNLLTGQILCGGETFHDPMDRDLTFEKMHRDIAANSFAVACTMNQGIEVLRTMEMIKSSSVHKTWMTR